ncbi:MAG: PKD domain-containing protein [Candidatus Altiarchaeota archaeon]|nr:PKD domain-containing protein [Candidatus Altiarchaeota archaeon]
MDKPVFLVVIFFLLLATVALGDECGDCCSWFCDEDLCKLKCGLTVVDGCWFRNTGVCHNCLNGDFDIKSCGDYPDEKGCEENRCNIGSGCEWNGVFCTHRIAPPPDCRFDQCPSGYRCMANGECSSLSVEEYCRDRNYAYIPDLLSRDCDDPILPPLEQGLCKECQSDYELNKTTGDIQTIIYGIAAGIAILMLTISGMSLLTSDDAVTRGNAKKSIGYIILGVVVIVSAVNIIGSIYKNPPTTPPANMSNKKPIADARVGNALPATLKYVNVKVGDNVYFDGSLSSDLDGDIIGYRWDFGDGTIVSGESVEHIYNEHKTFMVHLTVSDEGGVEGMDTAIVSTNLLESHILSPGGAPIIYQIGRTVEFRGAGRYGVPCSPPPEYRYNWTLDNKTFLGDSDSFSMNSLDFTPGKHNISLGVEDCGGGVAMDIVNVMVVKPLKAEILIPSVDGESTADHCKGLSANFTGRASGGLPPYSVRWKASGEVFAEGTISEEGGIHSILVPLGSPGLSQGVHDISFEVTDQLDLKARDIKKDITVVCDPCLTFSPKGPGVSIDGVASSITVQKYSSSAETIIMSGSITNTVAVVLASGVNNHPEWGVSNPDELNAEQRLQAIFEWETANMGYLYDDTELCKCSSVKAAGWNCGPGDLWLSGGDVLDYTPPCNCNPNTICGDCDDYAHLYISMARTAGISEDCVTFKVGPGHAFNSAKINKKWEYVDAQGGQGASWKQMLQASGYPCGGYGSHSGYTDYTYRDICGS